MTETAHRLLAAALLAYAAAWFAQTARCEPGDIANTDETARMRPTPARLAIWTDRLGYVRFNDRVHVYLAMDPARMDLRRYHEFIYLEHIDSGRRWYLARGGGRADLSERIVTARGHSPEPLGGTPIPQLPPTRIWSGHGLQPGNWQFVAELRSRDTTQIVKRAHAKFVVSTRQPVVLGAGGHDTEIAGHTTWTRNRIYSLRGRVFVPVGATLEIEPGTVVLARGPQAGIVVERGGRILARGRPDLPVVMTCDAPVGRRFAGCWGGLAVLGEAPMSRGTGLAAGVAPAARAVYGGEDVRDSSGVLQYLRVEFAGASSRHGARPASIALYGVGAGTRIDHVQAHASAMDGILFSGGTANCTHCVSSGARDDALAWELGWRGRAQHVFLQLYEGGGCGVEGVNDEAAFNALPRSAPALYNLTVVGRSPYRRSSLRAPCGIRLRGGSAVTARNVILTGFPSGAIDLRDGARSLFLDGTSSIDGLILHAGAQQSDPDLKGLAGYRVADPMLINTEDRPNPDPRPRIDSPALKLGAGSVPPSDGLLDTRAQHIGAFGHANWLEEWTFFGRESDFRAPETAAGEGGN